MSQTYVIWSIHVMCSLHFVCCVLVCCRKVIRVVCWIMRLHFVMFYNIILFMYFSVLIFLEFVCTVLLSRNVAIWAVLLTLPYKQEDRLTIKIKFNHLLIHKMSYNKSCILSKSPFLCMFPFVFVLVQLSVLMRFIGFDLWPDFSWLNNRFITIEQWYTSVAPIYLFQAELWMYPV